MSMQSTGHGGDAQLAAGARRANDRVHELRRADDRVDRARLDAQRAADAAFLVDDGDRIGEGRSAA